MKWRSTSRKRRTDVLRVRGVLERLEERALLSASHGPMGHGHGGYDFGPPRGTESRYSNTAMVASYQQRSVSYDRETHFAHRDGLSSRREFQDFPSMQSAYQSPPPLSRFEQRGFEYQDWSHVASNAPQLPIAYTNYFGPAYNSNLSPGATYSVWEYEIVSAPPSIQVVQHHEPSIADEFLRVQRSLQVKPIRSDSGADIRDLVFGSDKSSVDRPLQPRTVTPDRLRNLIPVENRIFGIEAPLSGLPIASQVLSSQTNTVGTLTAIAREVAFQEFSLKVFQPNAISTPDRASVDILRAETTQPEIADGFIQAADISNVSQIVSPSDAVAREREAVDAVLKDLHDVDAFRPDTSSGEINIQFNAETETALDELPGGEVDGGMVLLQATGDANESGFDLTRVYVGNVDQSNAPAKMETSVGMFQAVDVATDDAPIMEASQQVHPVDQRLPEVKLDDNLPTRREQPTSNKAATIVGATTVTGALVWLSRSGARFGTPLPTAQKRRASKR